MSKFNINLIALLLICLLSAVSCSSNPALPGQIEDPVGFNAYLEAANISLEHSKEEVRKAQAAVIESQKLLEEARALHATMLKLKQDQEVAVKKVRAERGAWERKRAEEERKKKEEEARLKAEAEATPTPPPYSSSDAPLKKK